MPLTLNLRKIIAKSAIWYVSGTAVLPVCEAAAPQSVQTAPSGGAAVRQDAHAVSAVNSADIGIAVPPHLSLAETLVGEIPNATLNVYGKGGAEKDFIEWSPDHPAARTVCSTFAAFLIQHAYGFANRQMITWLHSETPDAYRFYNAILEGDGFVGFHEIDHVLPGDFLAIRYNRGSDDTGHVMLVDGAPVAIRASAPLVPGTTQYSVRVIDSSKSGHGPADTRHRPGGGFTGGIGRGVCRLFADAQGKIVGYAWSLSPNSEYYTAPDRDLIVGRLKRTSSNNTDSTRP